VRTYFADENVLAASGLCGRYS